MRCKPILKNIRRSRVPRTAALLLDQVVPLGRNLRNDGIASSQIPRSTSSSVCLRYIKPNLPLAVRSTPPRLLYSRLIYYRALADKIAADPKAVTRPRHTPTDLGSLPERATNARHFYTLMLESCEKLFDNELEQAVFEDQLRWMFGPQVCPQLSL